MLEVNFTIVSQTGQTQVSYQVILFHIYMYIYIQTPSKMPIIISLLHGASTVLFVGLEASLSTIHSNYWSYVRQCCYHTSTRNEY